MAIYTTLTWHTVLKDTCHLTDRDFYLPGDTYDTYGELNFKWFVFGARSQVQYSFDYLTTRVGPATKASIHACLLMSQRAGRPWRDFTCNDGVGREPRGGTPYVMGDTYVPRFWPPFFTLAGSSTIFLGCFFSSTNTKTIFWVQILAKFDLFGPKIPFFPRSFWVQFSVARGTPPAIFGPSTPPPHGGESSRKGRWTTLIDASMISILFINTYSYICISKLVTFDSF